MKMPKTFECSAVSQLLFCYLLLSVFALDVIRIIGSSMSGGFVGIVDSTMASPFRVVVSVGLWISDPF
jgi:hypothetical protein